jgi:hypothetical protein
MGDPSDLRLVPDSSASIPIDWTRIPEATKKYFLKGWGYDWENKVQRSLPATIGELAKMLHESKFFGYMRPEQCTLLMDISELGLKDQQASGVLPRFYMKYLEAVWFILFLPGERNGISGHSPDIDVDEVSDDEDEDEEEQRRITKITKETELAQEFDRKLTREIPRLRGGTHMVNITKRLCGWDASMLEQSLESAQFLKAIMTLPSSHPAYTAMMSDVFSSIRRR